MGVDPISLMTIAKFVAAAGSVVSTVGGLQASNAAASVANHNALVMEENARKLAVKNQQDVQDLGQQQAAEKGQYLAELGASGIDLAAGSSALQKAALARLARRDAERTAVGGMTSVEAAKQGAADYRNQALEQRASGRIGMIGGLAGGLTSFIGDSTAIAKAKLDLIK